LRSIIRETENYSIIRTLANEFGHAIYSLPDQKVDQGKGILDCVLEAATEGGQACYAISESLKDGKITAKESAQCSSEIDDQINALIGLREKIVSCVVDPQHL